MNNRLEENRVEEWLINASRVASIEADIDMLAELLRRLAPDAKALGKRLIESNPFNKKIGFMEVVGVARDSKYLWPTERPRYFIFSNGDSLSAINGKNFDRLV